MSETRKEVHGAISKLTGKHVCQGARTIKDGRIYSLAVETSAESYAYAGRTYQILTDRIYVDGQHTYGNNKLQGFDDYLCMWCGTGTHLDGFAHVAVHGRHLHGIPSEEVIQSRGAIKYGIETVPPIAARGVLLDIARLKNVDSLAAGYEVTRQDLTEACAQQRVELMDGDVVLIHTGFLRDVGNRAPYVAGDTRGDATAALGAEPGIGLDAAKYLVEHKGVVLLGCDNWALEVIPAPDPSAFLPVHGYLLTEAGVHILENVWTRDLASDRIYEFFFIVAAPKLVGALQAPVHPVAIR